MMRGKILLLSTALILVISLASAVTAYGALPEFVNKEGKELSKHGVRSKSKNLTLGGRGSSHLKCKADTMVGQQQGTKILTKVTITFTGCTLEPFGIRCHSAGASLGEIKTHELEGTLGYIKASAKTVGFVLWPTSRTAAEKTKHEFKAAWVEFECIGNNKITGALSGAWAPVNLRRSIFQLVDNKGKEEGEQEVTVLEGVEGGVKMDLEASFEGSAFEAVAAETTDELEFEEEVEVRA